MAGLKEYGVTVEEVDVPVTYSSFDRALTPDEIDVMCSDIIHGRGRVLVGAYVGDRSTVLVWGEQR